MTKISDIFGNFYVFSKDTFHKMQIHANHFRENLKLNSTQKKQNKIQIFAMQKMFSGSKYRYALDNKFTVTYLVLVLGRVAIIFYNSSTSMFL